AGRAHRGRSTRSVGTLRRLVRPPNGSSPRFCNCGLLMTQLSPLSLSWGRPQQGRGLIGDGVWLELDLMAVTVAWMSRLDNRLPGDTHSAVSAEFDIIIRILFVGAPKHLGARTFSKENTQ
ncbi:Homogentisate 1,2-dioxygenase, partial [Clarias magur]